MFSVHLFGWLFVHWIPMRFFSISLRFLDVILHCHFRCGTWKISWLANPNKPLPVVSRLGQAPQICSTWALPMYGWKLKMPGTYLIEAVYIFDGGKEHWSQAHPTVISVCMCVCGKSISKQNLTCILQHMQHFSLVSLRHLILDLQLVLNESQHMGNPVNILGAQRTPLHHVPVTCWFHPPPKATCFHLSWESMYSTHAVMPLLGLKQSKLLSKPQISI